MKPVRYSSFLFVLVVLASGLLPSAAFSQDGVQEAWVMHLAEPDSGNDVHALDVDGEGNVVVTGRCFRYSTSSSDYGTVKYDPDGTEQWVDYYDGLVNAVDEGEAIATDAEGNVYVTGNAQEVGISFTTIKYDPDGAVVWTAVYGYDTAPGLENDPTDIAVDGDGNVYVTGRGTNIALESHYATVKFDPEGNLLWASLWGEDNGAYDAAAAIAVDNTGNVYVTGVSGADESVYDCVTVKYAPDGTELWVAQYDASGGEDDAFDIAVDESGNVYIGGSSEDLRPLIIKYAPDGTELWVALWDPPQAGQGSVQALKLDDEANVYVTGGTGLAYATAKYDTDGTLLWVSEYLGDPGDYVWNLAIDLALDQAGNAYVTGQCSRSNGIVTEASRTIKYAPDGTYMWDIKYEGEGDAWDYVVEGIALDDSGNVFIAGTGQPPTGGRMYTTVKYVQEPAAADDGVPSLGGPALYPSRPNPAAATTAIRYSLSEAGRVRLGLYNVSGERLSVLAEETRPAGQHEVVVRTGALTPGVYYYRLEADGAAIARRLVVVE